MYPLIEKELQFVTEIQELGNSVYNHSALNNKFYTTWKKRQLNKDEFLRFAIDYFYRVNSTVTRMSYAMNSFDDIVCKMQIMHNINDELGHGKKDSVHSSLAYKWLAQSFGALGGDKELKYYFKEANVSKATKDFIRYTNEMCATGSLEAAGSLLAQEWHGYTQIAFLLDGFKHYENLFTHSEKHELAEYFYVHLGKAEKEHIEQLGIITARICNTQDDFNIIKKYFDRYLDLLVIFWEGASNEIK